VNRREAMWFWAGVAVCTLIVVSCTAAMVVYIVLHV
jgi:hypothetical protein